MSTRPFNPKSATRSKSSRGWADSLFVAAMLAAVCAVAAEFIKARPSANTAVVLVVEEAGRLFALGLLPAQREAQLSQSCHDRKTPLLAADVLFLSGTYNLANHFDPTPPNSARGALAVLREARRLFELGTLLSDRTREVNTVNDDNGKPFTKEIIDFLCQDCGFQSD